MMRQDLIGLLTAVLIVGALAAGIWIYVLYERIEAIEAIESAAAAEDDCRRRHSVNVIGPDGRTVSIDKTELPAYHTLGYTLETAEQEARRVRGERGD